MFCFSSYLQNEWCPCINMRIYLIYELTISILTWLYICLLRHEDPSLGRVACPRGGNLLIYSCFANQIQITTFLISSRDGNILDAYMQYLYQIEIEKMCFRWKSGCLQLHPASAAVAMVTGWRRDAASTQWDCVDKYGLWYHRNFIPKRRLQRNVQYIIFNLRFF